MWPVESVIGENGGLFFRRQGAHDMQRIYWHDEADLGQVLVRLATVRRRISETIKEAEVADDQPFRLTSVASKRSPDIALQNHIVATLQADGLDVAINNLWILGWIGGSDKLTMAHRVMQQVYGVDVHHKQNEILYSGDSTNDAPMFGFFTHTVGVSTVREYEAAIGKMPNWITDGPGGSGFVEIAEAVITARRQRE